MTSVTNSWETYSLRVEPSIEHPQHNLWIIEADDPYLDNRLINAIVHGKVYSHSSLPNFLNSGAHQYTSMVSIVLLGIIWDTCVSFCSKNICNNLLVLHYFWYLWTIMKQQVFNSVIKTYCSAVLAKCVLHLQDNQSGKTPNLASLVWFLSYQRCQ